MMGARIVEPGCAYHAKPDFASYRPGTAHQHVWLANFFHRHKITDFCNALLGKETRHQHIGVGQVQLFVSHPIEHWMDFEAAALIIVEQSSKDRWGIESWKAHEVN